MQRWINLRVEAMGCFGLVFAKLQRNDIVIEKVLALADIDACMFIRDKCFQRYLHRNIKCHPIRRGKSNHQFLWQYRKPNDIESRRCLQQNASWTGFKILLFQKYTKEFYDRTPWRFQGGFKVRHWQHGNVPRCQIQGIFVIQVDICRRNIAGNPFRKRIIHLLKLLDHYQAHFQN